MEQTGVLAASIAVAWVRVVVATGLLYIQAYWAFNGIMINYIVRRLLYMLPVLIGVNILTFVLFFVVNSPDDMARMQLGDKYVSQAAIDNWKQQRGYDLPLLWNDQEKGFGKASNTIFFKKSVGLFVFDLGRSDNGRDIVSDIKQRMCQA